MHESKVFHLQIPNFVVEISGTICQKVFSENRGEGYNQILEWDFSSQHFFVEC